MKSLKDLLELAQRLGIVVHRPPTLAWKAKTCPRVGVDCEPLSKCPVCFPPEMGP